MTTRKKKYLTVLAKKCTKADQFDVCFTENRTKFSLNNLQDIKETNQIYIENLQFKLQVKSNNL